MAKVMIGVFNSLTDAHETIKELSNTGFGPDNIKLVTNDRDSEHLVDVRGLIGGLVGISAAPRSFLELSIPQQETDIYLEGVHQGQSLVVVTLAENQAERVNEVMSRHQPVEIVQP